MFCFGRHAPAPTDVELPSTRVAATATHWILPTGTLVCVARVFVFGGSTGTAERHCEPGVLVGPSPFRLEAGIFDQTAYAFASKFIAILGMNSLAGGKVDIDPCFGNLLRLLPQALEVHLHARLPRVPFPAMTKRGQIEIGIEFAVESGQYIQVELCGDALFVVVCRDQRLLLFHHICPEQQSVAG